MVKVDKMGVSKWAANFCHRPSDVEQVKAMYLFVVCSFVKYEAVLNFSDMTSWWKAQWTTVVDFILVGEKKFAGKWLARCLAHGSPLIQFSKMVLYVVYCSFML